MLESVVGKKIELMPKVPKENEILCDKCDGTGWLLRDNKWIENCTCNSGVIRCCPKCGTPYKHRYSSDCDNPDCQKVEREDSELKEREKELALFEKAEKIKLEDAKKEIIEMMYSDIYGYNEGYFTDIEEFQEYVHEETITEMPKYVWATNKTKISIDAESIVENACEELHEDAFGNLIHLNALQEFLDEWCDKQEGTNTYYPDYRYAILI